MIQKALSSVNILFRGSVAKKAARQKKINRGSGEMGLIDHVRELRDHIVKSALFFLGALLVCIVFMERIISWLRIPYRNFQVAHGKPEKLLAIGLFEVITMNLKICFMAAFLLSLPYFMRRFWLFVSPALYERERKIAMPVTVASIAMFYLGIIFGFFVIVPMFLSSTMEWAQNYAEISLTVENYFSALALMLVLFGVIFEVPVILSLLSAAGIMHSNIIAKNRRMVCFICFVVGAVISPPDVLSQVLVSVPLYMMCELSVISMRYIEKARKSASVTD